MNHNYDPPESTGEETDDNVVCSYCFESLKVKDRYPLFDQKRKKNMILCVSHYQLLSREKK